MRKRILAAVLAVCIVAIGVVTAVRGVRHRDSVAASSTNYWSGGLTLIIDAGHGGADGGAVSITGVPESEFNMDIAKRAELIAAFFGVNTVMTRYSDDLAYSETSTTLRKMKSEDQQRRLALINGTERAVLLSIHQNTYPSSGPHGAQVLYAPTERSAEWGKTMQELLTATLDPTNTRAAIRIQDTILLMNHIKCPAILVECGFLSNVREEALLRTDAYRLKVAATLIAGYLQSINNLQ
ncbi:MAG: N-acetylmuramoyl-L-alanine amidase [Oscillospiraceae bacterium]|jgi:N-acetylmuramoyl-L-alanine amidase|nr:N-acetylmuramoyl-L-alanine amidase [Oscillospiraceae bacterium]